MFKISTFLKVWAKVTFTYLRFLHVV